MVFQNVTPLKFQHQKNHELHNLANFEKIITFGLFCGKIVKKYFALIFIFFLRKFSPLSNNFLRFCGWFSFKFLIQKSEERKKKVVDFVFVFPNIFKLWQYSCWFSLFLRDRHSDQNRRGIRGTLNQHPVTN